MKIAACESLAGKTDVQHSEEEYKQLVVLLDSLIDEVGENESHPLASLMEIVGVLIERYEDEHVSQLAVDNSLFLHQQFLTAQRITMMIQP